MFSNDFKWIKGIIIIEKSSTQIMIILLLLNPRTRGIWHIHFEF